jgi:hypothetical protein
VTGIARRTFLKGLIAAGVGGVAGVGADGYLYGRHALGMTQATVPVARLPEALSGLRVGFLTDVHRSRWVSADDVAHAVTLLMDARPDLIVLGGDYVTRGDREYVGPSAEALARLSAPNGVFAILGNHDDDHDMAVALSAQRIEVLKDARTRVTIRNEPLELVGIRFWTRRAYDIEPLLRGATGTVVLLAHDPRRLVEAESLNIPLVLSGHTHGGQITLARLHEITLGKIGGHKYLHGLYGTRRPNGNGGAVYVGAGIGAAVMPLRIGERGKREVTIFELGVPPGIFDEHHTEQEALPGRTVSARKLEQRIAKVARKRARRANRQTRQMPVVR